MEGQIPFVLLLTADNLRWVWHDTVIMKPGPLVILLFYKVHAKGHIALSERGHKDYDTNYVNKSS